MSVPELLSDARSYTASLVTQAKTAMDAAVSDVNRIGYVIPNIAPLTLPSSPPTGLDITAPTLGDVALDLPPDPGAAPIFQDISPLDPGVAPLFTAVAPTITLPTTPSSVAAFQDQAPAINSNIAFPEPPSALMNPLIDSPLLTSRVEPLKPQVSLPVFDAAIPVDTTVAPTDLEARFSDAYRSAAPSTIAMLDGYVDAQLAKFNPRYAEQMGRIEDQLATYLAGGTGISPAVESAIYERSRGKTDADARRARDAAYVEAAGRGFTMPPGFLLSAVQQARQAGADNNARAAGEIVVMQAELEQKNLQFAVTTSAGLRVSMLNAALSYHQNLITINGQALDYAKSVLNAILEMYNTGVKVYSLKLDGYKAEAAVFEVRLKSALAGIELYKVEIAALEALTNVDKAKVDVYRARIDALSSLSNVYRSQIEAVQGRVSLEKLKLDVFQARVQAYATQVQAKNAEWQGYSAAVNGEQSKAQLFQAQASAFGAQVQGYRAIIDGKSEVVRATAATNDARAKQYAAILSGYSAVVQARGDKARTQLENQRQVIVGFQAQSQAQVANAQVAQEYYKSVSQIAIENAKLQLSAQVQVADSTRAFGDSLARLGSANATIFGNLAGAAMSGMNTLAAETLAG